MSLETIFPKHLRGWRENAHDWNGLSDGRLLAVGRENRRRCWRLILSSMTFVLNWTQRVFGTFRSFKSTRWGDSKAERWNVLADRLQVMTLEGNLCGFRRWNILICTRQRIHVQSFACGRIRFLVFVDEGIEVDKIVFHWQRAHAVAAAWADGARSRTWRWTIAVEERYVFRCIKACSVRRWKKTGYKLMCLKIKSGNVAQDSFKSYVISTTCTSFTFIKKKKKITLTSRRNLSRTQMCPLRFQTFFPITFSLDNFSR